MKRRVMINKSPVLYLIFLCVVIIILANSGGSPGGYTGSKSDKGATCASSGGCHASSSSTITSSEMISSDIPASGYVPGKQYTVIMKAAKSGVTKFGFEITSEDSLGNGKGTFSNTSEVNIKSNGKRATHKSSNNSGSGSKSWTFSWTAPVKGSGSIHFFAAALVANNNGNTSGDNVLIDTLSIAEASISSTDLLNYAKIKIYPNPTSKELTISGYTGAADYTAIFNSTGNLVFKENYSTTLNIAYLEAGVYYLKIVSGTTSVTRPFIKK
ncbi:MAG TPA: hypothetical protein DEQ56_01480 [Bacteroidetes bacterium]|jgi:hypothetical protein|nr:hypothetical protein [Bacteroidota bacterium]